MKKIVAVAVAATEPKNDLCGAAKTKMAVGRIAAFDIVATWQDRTKYYSLVVAVVASKDAVVAAAGTGHRPPPMTTHLRSFFEPQ